MMNINELLNIDAEMIERHGYDLQARGDHYARVVPYGDFRAGLGFSVGNERGETLYIEVSSVYDDGSKNSITALWHEHGYTAERMPSFISMTCEVTDARGNCFQPDGVNPTIKPLDYFDGQTHHHRDVHNFDYVLKATPENADKLIELAARNFYARKRD